MGFEKACSKKDCSPGKMVETNVNGKDILIANVDGKYYACGARCTHQDGPLPDGELNGSIVTCPLHGATYDVKTGKHTGGPGSKNVKKYKVKETDGNVEVDA